jgi:alkylation response protein AidB-like acyl-CoA dehydrogenase
LTLTDVDAPLQKTLDGMREFIEGELYPLEWKLANEGFDAIEPAIVDARKKVRDNGWWAPHFDKEYGGMGLSLLEFARVGEVLATTPLGHYAFNCQAPDVGNSEILHAFGTEAQKQQWLVPIINGEIRSCFSMTEPEHPGSNPTVMSTSATKDGDDYLINGHKWFTSSADGAALAVVMAITNPDQGKHARASQILVPTDTPGFELVRNISIMGDVGAGWGSHAEVQYTDVRVPQSNLLGEEGSGFTIAQERLGPGRIHHCMRWIGIAERALDLMCRYAVGRQLTSTQVLADQGTIQNWVAESRAEINASRLMVLDTAHRMDRDGASATRNEISMMKFYVAPILMKVLDRAIQVHGALGMTDDTPLSYWYRHERAARIYDGPDEVHKMVVARRILGEYGNA